MNFDLTEEQKIWQKTVHDFVAKEVQPKAHEVDVTSEFNWTATRKMGPLGLLGLNIPEDYGGAGVDAISAAIALEEIGWGCGSTALAIAAHNGLGTTPIVLYGSEELKQKWLPLVASGKNKLGRARSYGAGSGFRFTGWSRDESRERRKRMGDQWRKDVVHERVHCRIHHHPRSHGSCRWLAFAESDPCPNRYTRSQDRSRRKEDGAARLPHSCSDL